MKKEYESPEAEFVLFGILSCFTASWEEEDDEDNPFGRIRNSEENPWG